tara:strand:+ start:405 stop:707 length:303 start_codon:yes stop_codon:yes gene_type:complete
MESQKEQNIPSFFLLFVALSKTYLHCGFDICDINLPHVPLPHLSGATFLLWRHFNYLLLNKPRTYVLRLCLIISESTSNNYNFVIELNLPVTHAMAEEIL